MAPPNVKTYVFTVRVELQGRFEIEAEDSEAGRRQAERDAVRECRAHGDMVDWDAKEYKGKVR